MTTANLSPQTATKRTFVAPHEATQLVLQAAAVCPPVRVPLADAHGRVLAEAILADCDYPPFDRAMMDGYAVAENAAGRQLAVVGLAAAGRPAARGPALDGCIEIMTGSACPPGTDAVVQKEHVRMEGARVVMPQRIAPGQHISRRGSECRRGELVLHPGQRLDALGIAALSTFGVNAVLVVRQPRLTIIATGGELVKSGQTPVAGQIRDANGPMLAVLAQTFGQPRPAVLHAADEPASLAAALAAASDSDVVLISGGVSAGRFDLVPAALEQAGTEVIFHKVVQKPGKPLLVARRGAQLFFGLPGNPLACHLCFHRYVAPALRIMRGEKPSSLGGFARLAATVSRDRSRTRFVLATLEPATSPAAPPLARPLPTVSSADIFHGCGATAYLEIMPGTGDLCAGDVVPFTAIAPA